MQYKDPVKEERFRRKFEKRQRKNEQENNQKFGYTLYQNITSVSRRFELNVLDYYCHYFDDKKNENTEKQLQKMNQYQTLQKLHLQQSNNFSGFQAHQYVDYFYFQFIELIEKINDLRQKYAQSHSIELDNQDILDPKSQWVSIFCRYFRFRIKQKWGFNDDGTQKINDQKFISKAKLKLQQNIFSQKSDSLQKEEAFELIYEYCIIDFRPFDSFKLKQHWEPYCTDQFLNVIEKKYYSDAKMQKCICYYILLATGGLILLDDHRYKHFDNKEKCQTYPSNTLCLAVNFQEALTKYTLVESMAITERVPKINSQTKSIENFQEEQYLLFTNIRFFNTHQLLKDASISEVESEGLNFLESLNLEKNLYHHILKNDKVELSGQLLFNNKQVDTIIQIKGMAYFSKDQQKNNQWYNINSLPINYFTFCKNQKTWIVDYGHLQTFEQFKGMKKKDIQIQIETQKTQIQEKKTENQNTRFMAEQNIMTKMQNKNVGNQMEIILKLLPVFHLNLNKTQINLITSTENMLCLGRSGTGKTTALIMRMFAQEILYRRLLKQQKILKSKINTKMYLTAEDMLANTNVRYVFVTASPVLSSEVSRFYTNLKETLINHLKALEFNRNQRNQQRLLMLQNQEQLSQEKDIEKQETSDSSSDEEVKPQTENNIIKALQADEIEKQELLQFIEMQERDLMEQSQVEQILQMPSAFTDLKSCHFPLFTTIQKLIYMLDACLPNSFFTRDKNKNIIGMSSNLGWHSECASFGNENQGVMMINTHHRTNIDFNHQIGKFGEQLLEIDQDQDQIQQLLGEQADQIEFKQQWEIIQERDQQLKEHINQNQTEKSSYKNIKKIDADMRLSFEVTFEIFENQFYSRLAMQRAFKKLSASSVWTEIYSVIKGGMRAAESQFGYVQLADYIRLEGSEYLSGGEKRNIYYAFLAYEKWKKNVGAFDFMDVVQHVWKNRWQSTSYVHYYRRFYTSNLKYDYLLVDEVQDLPPKAIKLLLECASENVFFAGDTAQTIAKGVGSRFGDLRQTFQHTKLGQPKVIQLSTNYRSHQQILELANSVVSLIELFFPKSIDKLFKEGAERQGLIPIILQPVDSKLLSKFIMGAEMSNKIEQNMKQQQNETSPQFGCSQVVIVRDQAQKKQLPSIFENFLCLTVYEAKGLEFNDVIIYNFFDESETNSSQWKLLNDLIYKTEKRPKINQEILDMDLLDNKNFQDFQKKIKEYENLDLNDKKNMINQGEIIEYEEILTLEIKEEGMFHKKAQASNIYKLFSFLCIELKLLYVIITRAKNRIIIYDDYTSKRDFIQTYWQKLGLVHVVTKQMMMDPSQMPAQIKSFYEQGMTDDTTTPEQWKIQGIKLFQKKYYDQAIKCFTNSGNQNLVLRCEAHLLADKAEKLKNEANSLQWKVRNFSYLSKQTKRQYANDSKQLRKESQQEFKKAGNLFSQCGMFTFAGSCYFTANCLVQAAEMYQKLKRYAQAGECYFKLKKFEYAAQMFEEGKLMPRAIECYEITQSWDQLLHSLSRCKDQFKDEERQSLVNKYVPIALNSLYKLLSKDYQDIDKDNSDKNKGQIQEMKIKMKYQKFVDQIVEEDEYGEEFEEISSDDNQQQKIQEENDLSQEENKSDQQIQENEEEEKNLEKNQENKNQEETSQKDKSFEIEEESDQSNFLENIYKLKEKKMKQQEILKQKIEKSALQKEKEQKQNDDASFEVEEDSQNDEEDEKHLNNKLDDFEHLSQFDPDDEFLQSERSFSIIDSIMSDTKSFGIQSVMSSTSEFSIVQSQFKKSKQVSQSILSANSQISYNRQIEQIQTNQKDVYVEDIVTQKIIYYISLFSDEVKDQLSTLRDQGILRDYKQKDLEKGTEVDEFLISLDQVSIEFINTIIDILDYYEMFKLSMMLCNRYGLTDRIGRYILQISSKYTNINTIRYNYEILKPNSQIKLFFNQKQMTSSLLAHEALHNVFSLIDQKFLTLKPQGTILTEKNSLGMQTYRTLLNLGFWKKLVYITEVEMAIDLCFKFYNRQHFINIKENFLDLENLSKEKQKKYSNLERWMMIRDYQITFQSFQNQSLIGVQNLHQDQILNIQGLDSEQNQNIEIIKLIQKFNKIIRQGHAEWTFTPNQYEKYDQQKKTCIEIENQVLNQVFTNGTKDENNYLKYLISLNFVSQSKQLQSYLYKMNDFSQNTLHQLFMAIIQVLRYLTGIQNQREMHNEELIEAIHSTFLISDIDQNIFDSQFNTDGLNDNQGLFIDFQNKFMLMSVESPILSDYIKYQMNIQNHQHNQNLMKQLKKINRNYYSKYMDPFKEQISKIIRRFEKGTNGKMFDNPNAWQELIQDSASPKVLKKLNQTNQSFIIDLDCQFILVPKTILREVIFSKITAFLRQIQPKISAIITKQYSEDEIQNDKICLYECSINRETIKMFYKRFRQSQEIMKFVNKIVQDKYDEVIELQKQKLELSQNYLYIDYQANFKQVQERLFKIQNVIGVSDKKNFIEENGQVSRLANYFHDNKNNLELQFHIGLVGNSSTFGFDEDFATSQSIRILNNAFNFSYLQKNAARYSKDAPQIEDILQTALTTLLKSFSLILASEQSNLNQQMSGKENLSMAKYVFAYNKLFKQFKLHFSKCNYQNKMKKLFKGFKTVLLIHDLMSVGNYVQASYSYLDFINQYKEILKLEQYYKAIEMAFYCFIFSKKDSFQKKIYGPESLGYFTDLLQKDEIDNLVQQNVPIKMNELQIYIEQEYEDFKNYEYYEEIELKPLKMQKKESSYKEQEGMDIYLISHETIYSQQSEIKVGIYVFENKEDEIVLLNLILSHLYAFIKDFLNSDEYVNSKRNLFTNIYNMVLAVIVNTDIQSIKDNKLQKELIEKINKIFEQIMNGPFDSHFKNTYLMEQDQKMTVALMKEVYNEFHQTDDHLKYTFFDFFKNKYNESTGALCISIDLPTFAIAKSDIQSIQKCYNQLIFNRTKNILGQHLLKQKLQRMIQKQNLREKYQIQIKKQNINDDVKNLLNHFGLDLLLRNNLDEVEQIWGAIDNLSIRKHLLLEIISTKSAKTPIELDFIDQKVSEINQQIYKYVKWLRDNYLFNQNSFCVKQDISQDESFAILDESVDQINSQGNNEIKSILKEIDQFVVKFDANISIWHAQKILEEEQNLNSEIIVSKEKRVMMKWSTLQKASRSLSMNILKANKAKLVQK